MQFAAAADDAMLVDLGEVSAQELHAAAEQARALEGVVACIPGHSSLYVVFSGSLPPEGLFRLAPAGAAALHRVAGSHRIPVSFTGPDLPELLERIDVPLDAFLVRVATLRLTARYIGFRGGFAYLEGWPEEWSMPRRPTSRPLVAAGSFAIGGSTAAFYPIDSPGGWNLLGRTDLDLENAIAAGDNIVIEPSQDPLPAIRREPREPERFPIAEIELIASPLARVVSVPDWSRIDRGMSPGGPFDETAASLARQAVGLHPGAPVIECAMTGPRLRARSDVWIAWCTPDLAVDLRQVRRGEEVAFGRISGGLRGYLAVGGIPNATMPLRRDDRLVIRAIAGPHKSTIADVECQVTTQLDRVGIRLRPLHSFETQSPSDLRSCGMQRGTVQLHPDGTLVAMGPDHPVTGGYLQPMTVIASDRWKLAQLQPGEKVWFRL